MTAFASVRLRDRVAPVPHGQGLRTRLARTEADLRAAQRLRYEVFIAEMGGDGDTVDHAARLEADRFDAQSDHLLLIDPAKDPAGANHVVGAYRLMTCARAAGAEGFYSASEFDIGALLRSGRRLLELGRSCVHRDYRGGTAMLHLLSAAADYARAHRAELLFGVASFPGTDLNALALPLSWLHHHHLAPAALRARALSATYQPMALTDITAADRSRAQAAIPALIRAYLGMGAQVGDGAFVDDRLRTTDVFVVLDTALMPERRRAFYARAAVEPV